MKILTENKVEATSKVTMERLQKIMINLQYSGRRIPPAPSNDPIYEATVDILVMISNSKLDYAINNGVIEFMKAESVLSE